MAAIPMLSCALTQLHGVNNIQQKTMTQAATAGSLGSSMASLWHNEVLKYCTQ